MECIDKSIRNYANMTFGALWELVHSEPAYKKTYVDNTSTPMPYELLLPDGIQNRDAIIAQVKETSQVIAI